MRKFKQGDICIILNADDKELIGCDCVITGFHYGSGAYRVSLIGQEQYNDCNWGAYEKNLTRRLPTGLWTDCMWQPQDTMVYKA